MNSFVRFIFFLVILGVAVNLAIVLMANTRSQRDQLRDMADEKDQFNALIARFNARQRRGDMTVEWQKIDSEHKVLQTSLLVRLYTVNEHDEREPLRILHVIIPGDKVNIDGLLVTFQPDFPEEYAALRDIKLAYFNHIYADGQPPEERFALLTHGEPPISTRMNSDHVTRYEIQFWKYAWDQIDYPPRDGPKTIVTTTVSPISRVVVPGIVYSFFISNYDSTPAISVNTDPGLLYELLHEPIPTDHPESP